MRNKKPTLKDKSLANCYEQLLKETGKVPTVAEVQQRYNEQFNR
jgi:hypothetical protein